MVNSLKQLFNESSKKRNPINYANVEFREINDYKMNMSNFNELIDLYESYPYFSQHTLLEIATNIFYYIK